MAIADNLVSYYKFDESSGNAADSVGSNTGTNVGTATYTSGKINNALTLNGSTQCLTVGTSLLSAYTGVSVACWIKLTALDAYMHMIGKTDDTTYNQLFRVTDTNRLQATVTTTTETYITGGTTLTTGVWYFAVYTWDGSNINLYLNGSTDATAVAKTGTMKTSSDLVSIGRSSVASASYFSGQIDEVGIWSRALTTDEISTLYNAGAGNQYPFMPTFTISEALSLTETTTTLRGLVNTISESLNLSETVSALKGLSVTVLENLSLTETLTTLKTRIFNISESLGVTEVLTQVRLTWNKITKQSTTWTDISKN